MAIDLGFTPQQNLALRLLLGKPLTHPDVTVLGSIWNEVANAGEVGELREHRDYETAKRFFNNHRKRFWKAVRRDAFAKSLIAACGAVFRDEEGGEGANDTAPIIRLASGYKTLQGKDMIFLDIDHEAEKRSQPELALEPTNLRIIFSRENRVVLRLLHQLDPFQSPELWRSSGPGD
ncbi:hypothetical protein ElP_32380 [Tautonia plasticadhaerens]|uniref:Uncharacterized protein n=2 Tax=Tautonia plasticadhaerens TaxID=2527974 RepID=A0A518H3B1_9BACT|nr:hypothetical protein ElP_32380 [Tautonia plasticadhaerens]